MILKQTEKEQWWPRMKKIETDCKWSFGKIKLIFFKLHESMTPLFYEQVIMRGITRASCVQSLVRLVSIAANLGKKKKSNRCYFSQWMYSSLKRIISCTLLDSSDKWLEVNGESQEHRVHTSNSQFTLRHFIWRQAHFLPFFHENWTVLLLPSIFIVAILIFYLKKSEAELQTAFESLKLTVDRIPPMA